MMKIGILTFHSQLNYGGLLQAYALQRFLEELGHEVIILDRWSSSRNGTLLGPFTSPITMAKWFAKWCLGRTPLGLLRRHWKTIRFVRRYFHLSPYHFTRWEEVKGKDLGVDCVVVGSDQVWNGTFNDPAPFLLAGAPPDLPALSYAASFGMTEIPEALASSYREGFRRFSAISVREAEGCDLVRKMGGEAVHVVDPTLLLDPSLWAPFHRSPGHRKRVLVCYLLSVNPFDIAKELLAFQERADCEIDIFTDSYECPRETIGKANALRRVRPSIRFRRDAAPDEFVDAISSADWVLTDSFHAVMFSSVFNRDVRVLRPVSAHRKGMFSRIEEVRREMVVSGELVSDTVETALRSFMDGPRVVFDQEEIGRRRSASGNWLREALARIEGKAG